MSRAKFETRDYGMCVRLTQPDGRIREFHIPHTSSGSGYIREGSNMGPQVCDGLTHSGSTLMATPETLEKIIKREWTARRRSARFADERNFE